MRNIAVDILIQDIVDLDENGVPRGTARDRITLLDFSNMNIYEIDVGAFQDLNLPALEDIFLRELFSASTCFSALNINSCSDKCL